MLAIETKNLRKTYGAKAAVDGLSLSVPQGCFVTGENPSEQEAERHQMIWAPTDQWTKPTPFQIRGLASAWYEGKRGAQSALAEAIGVQKRTWRNWAKLINNKKTIPWHVWQLMLIISNLHSRYAPMKK